MAERTAAETLRAWASAYRDGPVEHRFPSDPHAEFFPKDMEWAADEMEWLRKERDAAQANADRNYALLMAERELKS